MAAISWKAPVDGNWDVAANWSTGAVPTSADDVLISAPGSYTVTISSNGVPVHPLVGLLAALPILSFPDEAKSLTFNAPVARLLESSGSLDIEGALTLDAGSVSLNEANTFGSVAITGGTLAFGNGGALGTAIVSTSGGELLGTANETLNNSLLFTGTSTIAAADGTTLTQTGSLNVGENTTLNFGAAGENGVVDWSSAGGTLAIPSTFNVAGGTLKIGGAQAAGMLNASGAPTTVDAGATLDVGGFGIDLNDLSGSGAVTDSGAAATLTLEGANFSGAISGALSLVVKSIVTLSGNSTYTGTTTIASGEALELGLNGTTGSIGGNGAIVDNGTLYIFRDNAITLANAISGAGALRQIGTGVTSINSANTYTGGTMIFAGALAIGNAGALGTGAVAPSGGELLATATETLTNALALSGTSTLAAAHGKTLTEDASLLNVAASSTLNFGATGEDGTILWHTPSGSNFSTPLPAINVQAGTLKGADSAFGFFLDDEVIKVAAGGTLDLAGNSSGFIDLTGGGSVTDSGAAATLTLDAANFTGAISGALALIFNGDTTLSGLEDYTGGATLNGTTTVDNLGTYDLVANTNITGSATASFVNNNLFEKSGGGGVSDVTTNFVNDGTLNVLSGSIEFSGGFTNNGVIHGLVTQSGGVTTVSAAVPSDFNGDTLPDILWQNKQSGQASVWEMNENARTGGGPVSSNPGPSWTAVGSGDFNGDGHADILWQNSDGQASVWEMNGNTRIGGGPVSSNPGPSWKAIGTGDFNGDGLSDILFQNASTGQVSIWEMNENIRVGGGPVTSNPGPAWKAVGTGDFNGDGLSDILFQNASTGQVAIWEMNGSTRVGGGAVANSPGPAWKVVGSGDFNHDGDADILFQNTTTGQLSIWEMNGNTRVGGGVLGANLGPSWRAVGIGGGGSDILLQSASGQATIWEMNGNAIAGGGLVATNPGPDWRAVA